MVHAPPYPAGDAAQYLREATGNVEVGETFIGGTACYMHADKRNEKIHGRGAVGTAVMKRMLERRGEVKATVVKNRKKGTLQAQVGKHVVADAEVHTDNLASACSAICTSSTSIQHAPRRRHQPLPDRAEQHRQVAADLQRSYRQDAGLTSQAGERKAANA